MKVKDLQKILSSLNPELDIILQKDSEGNGFSPLRDYKLGSYYAYNAWSGEVVEEQLIGDVIPVIVLIPAN